ncbi:hypothetical protein [Nocardia brasiliensis]|uniref:nSTAND1 domain-containing NTPase n=1 Tax=Nocardia brasiliensis TaxID=37326 RepID=UPI0018963018|nr:hypothetical protein [Nocardia brasiliensis]MBF6544416.1 hypothetical protein [Nocardia brasiliensis]
MEAASARRHFAERLTALFELAGAPPVKSVVRRANLRIAPGSSPVTVQRISDWRRGARLPASFETVLPTLAVLIGDAKARTQPAELDRTLLDPAHWRAAWQTAKADQSQAALVVREPDHPPYRGLSPYRPADADLYFGRDSLRESVVDAITAIADDGELPRLVLVIGVSGAGKSSLLAAGLQADPGARTPVLITPGARPAAALRAALDATGPDDQVLLLIDQGEELFTRCAEDARRAFLEELRRISAPDGDRKVTTVMAIRSDFFNDVIQYPLLAAAMKDASVIVVAMTEAELRDVIVRPALACGVKVEPALVDVVLHDLDTATSGDGKAALLPLLSHVLDATWSRRRGRTLTLEAYREAGEMAGSVAATAERAWSELSAEEQVAARAVLLMLIIIGPRSVTRDRLPRHRVVEEAVDPRLAERVIAHLVDARIVLVHDGEIELLHDAVPRVWPRMAEWIEAEKEFGPARHRIEDDARAWLDQGTPDTLLYDAERLETVDVVTGNGGSINRTAQEFVARSRRQVAAASARRKFLRTAAVLLVVVALLAATVAISQYRVVSHERTDAAVAALVHESQRIASFDPTESARMALAAYRIRPGNPDTQARLLSTQAYPVIRASAQRHTGKINGLAYFTDRRLIASAGDDTQVRLWQVGDNDQAVALGDGLGGHERAVAAVAFGPDGGLLVSVGYDQTVRLWDVRDPARVRVLGTLDIGTPALSVVFAAQGRAIVVAGENGELSLVDVTDPAAPILRERQPAHSDAIRNLAADAGGSLLASGGDDGTVRLWDLTDPARLGPLGAPLFSARSAVHALAIGPGDLLAAGAANGAVRMWSLADRTAPREFGVPQTMHTASVDALLFGPHGLLASGAADGTVLLWQLTATGFVPIGRPIGGNRGAISGLGVTASVHLISAGGDGRIHLWTRPPADIPVTIEAPFTSVELDAAGSRLVTAGEDGQFQVWLVEPDRVVPAADVPAAPALGHGVRVDIRADGAGVAAANADGGAVQLWSLADPARPIPVGAPLRTRTRYFTAAQYTPDGNVLVTGDDDYSIRLWAVGDPADPRPLGAATSQSRRSFRSLAVSRDGTLVATGSGDAAIYLWDIRDRDRPVLRTTLTGHEGPVSTLAFANDARYLFSAADDGTIRSWDLSRPSESAQIAAVHTASVSDLSLDHTGRRLATAGADQSVRLWDVSDPARPRALGRSISSDIGARWFVRFDRADDKRLFGVADLASERWVTDPAVVADQLCRTIPVAPEPLDSGGSTVSYSGIDLCR